MEETSHILVTGGVGMIVSNLVKRHAYLQTGHNQRFVLLQRHSFTQQSIGRSSHRLDHE